MAEDLINLKQKDLTVVQHEAQFSKLTRFVPPWVDSDVFVARMFEGGLRPQIKALVMPFELKTYRDIAIKASFVEKCLLKVDRDGYDVQKKRHAIEVPQREQDSYSPEGRDSKYLRLQMERDSINLKQNNSTVAEYDLPW
ncbi:uncharacterized protein LOC125312914 [Rhodamnia argentea]|uniref:Uncharacterized protein LOC125312914 n=1 Tax=Rhodamnia argentea TaxID=178133 RepID=A0ABM3GXA9_9MYRT|nr:uncharacterized protein LOC125312914 [Rhodamnia argentea]